ncbi:SAM-dependent methyltransferase, partial [Enterococcus hirae]
ILQEQIKDAGLALTSMETFGACYARTLAAWRDRFQAAWPQLSQLGFDERFRRMWIYYLSYCEAGFSAGELDVGLYRIEHPKG